MNTYIAFLRAVNVGGTGKLPMAELRELCAEIGFKGVRTYIASGNVVLESRRSKANVKAALQRKLAEHMRNEVGVVVRTPAEVRRILDDNPYPDAHPSRTLVTLLDEPPPPDALQTVSGKSNEEIHVAAMEIYVHFPDGMGRSKLRIPAAAGGTARNINTIRKMVELSSA